MLRCLHTADWHLGKTFFHENRAVEHEQALNWLVDLIKEQKVELLIIAGDIFDTDTPPNYARRQYYHFLHRLVDSCCENIVVIGGNHDSPSVLDSPSELLSILNVHVVGAAREAKEECIEIRNKKGDLRAVVGAVPFLRDRDLRQSRSGETLEERRKALINGMRKHYEEVAEAMQAYSSENVPLIATGHLFAQGGERAEGRLNQIHLSSMGGLDSFSATDFSAIFDYVALGHLHRPQKVGGLEHIRYSGSLIAMDFNETNYPQSIYLLDFEQRDLKAVETIRIPQARKLRLYQGDEEHIRQKLLSLEKDAPLSAWIKVRVQVEERRQHLESELRELLKANGGGEIFGFEQKLKQDIEEEDVRKQQDLESLTELQVFQMLCKSEGYVEGEELDEVLNSFKELIAWEQQREKG